MSDDMNSLRFLTCVRNDIYSCCDTVSLLVVLILRASEGPFTHHYVKGATATFTTTLWSSPDEINGMCASSGKKITNAPFAVEIQASGLSAKNCKSVF